MNDSRSRLPHASASTRMAEAQTYEDEALSALRAAGYRITMPRVLVIRALADTTRALSAYAVHEKIVADAGRIDVVSVYRILTTLQEVGMIYHIGIVDGYFPCRIRDAVSRSEVMVSEKTNEVLELHLPAAIVDAISEQAEAQGFSVSTIKVEITG